MIYVGIFIWKSYLKCNEWSINKQYWIIYLLNECWMIHFRFKGNHLDTYLPTTENSICSQHLRKLSRVEESVIVKLVIFWHLTSFKWIMFLLFTSPSLSIFLGEIVGWTWQLSSFIFTNNFQVGLDFSTLLYS